MSDDLTKRRPQDTSRVNIHEPWELEYWTRKLGCTKTQLETAVRAAGTSAEAVEKHLKGK